MKDKNAYKKAPPAFQFYATDILANKHFRLMNLNERGCFITLLSECWANQSLPADADELSRFIGIDCEEVKKSLTKRVLEFFKISNGVLSSPDLDAYKAELEKRRSKQSAGGKKGQDIKKSKLKVPEGQPSTPRVEMSGIETSKKEQSHYKEGIDHEWVNDYDNT